jgi:hypothetical protein
MTITTDDGEGYHHPRYHHDDDYRPHHRWDADYQDQDRRYQRHSGCFEKTVEQHHNGMMVVKKTRVCH